MDRRKKILIVFLLAVVVLVYFWLRSRSEQAAAEEPVARATTGVVADQVLIDLANDATDEEVAALERRLGLKLRLNSRFSRAERLYRAIVRRPARLLAKLRREPLVERAERDVIYRIPPLEAKATRFAAADEPGERFPNDPKFKYQWHLLQIEMRKAWKRAQGAGVTVAVIDTGVAYTDRGKFKRVPDLASTAFARGYDFVNDHEHPLDDHGHGTHVAGTIAQSTHNRVGVAGVAFKAKIMPLKVLSSRGFGNVADIAEAVRFATDNGAKVINMSLGGPRASKVLSAAVKYAADNGVLVVCAAGNEGRGRVSYPAAYPGAMAVAATQFDRKTTFYSNWGKQIAIAAPGGNTRVDQNGDGVPDGVMQNTIIPGKPDKNDYLLFMGTSMASPHVAGVAALVFSSGVSEPAKVREVLMATARHPRGKKWDERYGAGIVDANGALRRVQSAWGLQRLGLGAALALLLAGWLRRRRQLDLGRGAGVLLAGVGVLAAAGGGFFWHELGVQLPSAALAAVATRPLPEWGMGLWGAAGANPICFSAALPLAATALLWGVRRLHPLLFGLSAGFAAHLLFNAWQRAVDVVWIPNGLGLDEAWLLLNAVVCAGLALLVARR